MPKQPPDADTAFADTPVDTAVEDRVAAPVGAPTAPLAESTIASSEQFLGRWNKLVSSTNWEKGRIIADWRAALERSGAEVTQHSDEAWAQLVGGVSSQHVGRLRRVHQKFGAVREEYPGLYWSHFQASLDWQDAEMWLEGAIGNAWSVSQMRSARWEAVGAPDGLEPASDEAGVYQGEIDEDAYAAIADRETAPAQQERAAADGDDERDERDDSSESSSTASGETAPWEDQPSSGDPAPQRDRPFANLAELPDDLAEAFEHFKLAILSHKLTGWGQVSRDDVLHALDSLRKLAMAPSGDDAPR
ncbi:MAG: hypothetical protein ACRCT8_01625 [Lacipirellulaceae bacterium]